MSTQFFETKDRSSQSGFFMPLAGLLLFALPALVVLALAHAQDDDEDDEKRAVEVQKGAPALVEANLEQWVFQIPGGASGARSRLDSMLALHVAEIDRSCKLTDAQKKKLQLSGRGDIKRFWERFDEIKRKFKGVRQDDQKFQQIWQEIQPLQMTLQGGLFHDDSLLVKTLPHTLTVEQFAGYGEIARERRAFRHRASVETAVSMLEQGAPLRDEQRQAFITLLSRETKPSRKSGMYEFYAIVYQMSQIPEGKLKPLFDDVQWKRMSRQLAQGKAMEQWLKQSGQLPGEEDEADKAEAPPPAQRK